MNKIIERPLLAVSILIVLCAYLFFFKLGNLPLTDPDETFYAQSAKEMSVKGDWLTPHLYGKPQFEKPILIYWLIGASYKIFGINEASARIPSAIFGLLGVVAMYLLGSLLFGKRAGFLSAVILATGVEYIMLSRACVTDMTLTVFMLLGVLFFFYGYLKEKPYFYLLSSAAFAFAVLAKGPVAIILPVLAFIVFLFIAKDLGRLKKIPVGWCLMVFALVAAPWYIAAYRLHGKEFIDAFFGFQNVTRFVQAEHKIGSQVYYNIPIILGGFFPWSVFLPFGFWYMFKKSRAGSASDRAKPIFILTWFFVIFLFFTASSTKLPTYVFPSFISLALIVGALWNDFLNAGKEAKQISTGMKASFYPLVVIIAVGGIAADLYVRRKMPAILPGVAVSTIILISGFAISTVLFALRKYIASLCAIVVSLAIFLLPLDSMILPEVGRRESAKELAQKLKPMMGANERLGSQSDYMAGLAFYADKFPEDLDRHQNMVNFLNSEGRVWCVIKDQNHRGLYDPTINEEYVKPSYLLYKAGKRVIVTNKIPEDGKYLLKREFAK